MQKEFANKGITQVMKDDLFSQWLGIEIIRNKRRI